MDSSSKTWSPSYRAKCTRGTFQKVACSINPCASFCMLDRLFEARAMSRETRNHAAVNVESKLEKKVLGGALGLVVQPRHVLDQVCDATATGPNQEEEDLLFDGLENSSLKVLPDCLPIVMIIIEEAPFHCSFDFVWTLPSTHMLLYYKSL